MNCLVSAFVVSFSGEETAGGGVLLLQKVEKLAGIGVVRIRFGFGELWFFTYSTWMPRGCHTFWYAYIGNGLLKHREQQRYEPHQHQLCMHICTCVCYSYSCCYTFAAWIIDGSEEGYIDI